MAQTTKTYFVLAGGVIILLLGCMLVFPFGPDQSIFSVGGELIFSKGAIPYRDFLESKPPLVFYIYGFAQWLFGYDQWAIRLFDALVLSASLVLYYAILQKLFRSQRIAVISVLLYTLLYVAGGYWETAQCESFALLPSLVILHSFLRSHRNVLTFKETVSLGSFIAVCAFVLFLLKFTLIYILVAYLFYLFFYSSWNSGRRNTLAISIMGGFGILAGICYLVLLSLNSVDNFVSTVTYVKTFAYGAYSGLELLKKYFYQEFPSSIVISFSPVMVILLGIGITKVNRYRKSGDDSNALISAYFIFAICQLCFGLLSILAERKFAPYNYQRLYWCAVPFMAFAIDAAVQRWPPRLRSIVSQPPLKAARSMTIALSLLAAVVFYSPLPRIVYHPLRWGVLALEGDTAKQDEILRRDKYDVPEIKETASFIQSDGIGREDLFLWGNTVGLYFYLKKVPSTICLANGQFIPGWPPLWWKDTLLRQLNSKAPKYFVVEFNDAWPQLTGVSLDSYEYLLRWPELRSFLEDHYAELRTIGHFKIYKRT